MSRITRVVPANGIEGANWHPYRDGEGKIVLAHGDNSEDAKTPGSTISVDTEEEAIGWLRTGRFWIRMTAEGTRHNNLIGPKSILIDGKPLDCAK